VLVEGRSQGDPERAGMNEFGSQVVQRHSTAEIVELKVGQAYAVTARELVSLRPPSRTSFLKPIVSDNIGMHLGPLRRLGSFGQI